MSGLEYAFALGVAAMGERSFYYPVDIGVDGNGRFCALGRSHEIRGICRC